MTKNAHIELLGRTAKDRVTGFTGVVTSISFDLYGCIQAAVNPAVDKDQKLPDGRWFDVNRLEVVSKTKRAMQVPSFAKAQFGETPATHTHGPADKPCKGKRL